MFKSTLSLWLPALLCTAANPAAITFQSQDFPKGAGPENLVLRPSTGSALVAIGTLPRIYQVGLTPNAPPQLVHEFPLALGVSSIAPATEPDVFYAITGNFSYATLAPTPGSYSMHRLSFEYASAAAPAVQDLGALDAIAQPNGMIHVPGTPYLLIADCLAGLVFRFNTLTRELSPYFDHALLKPQPQDGFAFGVNGLKLSRGYLYFSNTNQELVARVRATGLEPRLEGEPEVVATQAPVDDFIVDGRNGDLFLAFNVVNALGYLAHNANSSVPEVILGGGNSAEVLGPTSAIWAEGKEGRELLVPTTGGFLQFVEQNFTGGGRLNTVRVDECL